MIFRAGNDESHFAAFRRAGAQRPARSSRFRGLTFITMRETRTASRPPTPMAITMPPPSSARVICARTAANTAADYDDDARAAVGITVIEYRADARRPAIPSKNVSSYDVGQEAQMPARAVARRSRRADGHGRAMPVAMSDDYFARETRTWRTRQTPSAPSRMPRTSIEVDMAAMKKCVRSSKLAQHRAQFIGVPILGGRRRRACSGVAYADTLLA